MERIHERCVLCRVEPIRYLFYPYREQIVIGRAIEDSLWPQGWLDVLGKPNPDFPKQLHKGLLLAIEHGQVFVVGRIKEKVEHVLIDGQTWWYDKDAYALAFKLKKRWILPLFVPAVAGQDYEWYRECSKIMTVQEFVEAAEAEEEPCPTALRHDE